MNPDNFAMRHDMLIIFSNAKRDDVISSLAYLFSLKTMGGRHFIEVYCNIARELYKTGDTDLSRHILKVILEDDNFYIRKTAKGEKIPKEITECLISELRFFQELSQLTSDDFVKNLNYDGFLPKWTNSNVDIVGSYLERLKLIHRYGYGQYAQYTMFTLKGENIVPVKYPDKQRLSELFGYERERKAVIDNTLALIDGKPAQNVLLYGDAGTGKSSTVKAVVNEFADKGLRLVEITKEQLRSIPAIIDELSENPLKFIIFIDDLSFTAGEDCFGALKAVLEGSVSARSDNIAIYATSNRRHLVKENFSDREGDDIHRNDTMQETLSLSARFGLRVNFARPDKKEFIRIAGEIAGQKGLELDEKDFEMKAESFAMSSGNGRSPRTAKQFVNQLINQNNLNNSNNSK